MSTVFRFKHDSLTLSGPAFFGVSHGPGEGGQFGPPRYLSIEAPEELVINRTIGTTFSEDYFEVYNISAPN